MFDNKELVEECPLCHGAKHILQVPERVMGYTLAEGETTENTLDEHFIPCPLCQANIPERINR
jgi:hypothetical protein